MLKKNKLFFIHNESEAKSGKHFLFEIPKESKLTEHPAEEHQKNLVKWKNSQNTHRPVYPWGSAVGMQPE